MYSSSRTGIGGQLARRIGEVRPASLLHARTGRRDKEALGPNGSY